MEHFEDWIKKSIETHRGFPVRESEWLALKQRMKKRRRRLSFFWFWFGSCLLLVGGGFLTKPWSLYTQKEKLVSKDTSFPSKATTHYHYNDSLIYLEAFQVSADQMVSQEDEQEKFSLHSFNQANQLKAHEPTSQKEDLDSIESKLQQLAPVEDLSEMPLQSVYPTSQPNAIDPSTRQNEPLTKNEKNLNQNEPSKRKSLESFQFLDQSSYRFRRLGSNWNYPIQTMEAIPGVGLKVESIDLVPKSIIKRRGVWELCGSVGMIRGSKFTRTFSYYTTNQASSNFIFSYPLASGQRIDVFNPQTLSDEVREPLNFSRLSITRQWRSGLGLKLGLIYGFSRTNDQVFIKQLPSDPELFYFDRSNSADYWVGEFGFQFSTNPTKRWRAYGGINLFVGFQSTTSYSKYAVIRALGLRELDNSDFWRGNQIVLGYFIEAGVQWSISSSLSVGPVLFSVLPSRSVPFEDLPLGLGVETRWRF